MSAWLIIYLNRKKKERLEEQERLKKKKEKEEKDKEKNHSRDKGRGLSSMPQFGPPPVKQNPPVFVIHRNPEKHDDYMPIGQLMYNPEERKMWLHFAKGQWIRFSADYYAIVDTNQSTNS
jgi:hypothetical protein